MEIKKKLSRKGFLKCSGLKNEEMEELMELIKKFNRKRRKEGETERIEYVYEKKAYASIKDT